MSGEKKTWIALIRGIGPATHKPLPMKNLRAACEAGGFGNVKTVLATGNLIVSSTEGETHVRETISGIVRSAGLENEVFLRQPDDFKCIVATNPFIEAISERPGKVLVLFLAEELTPAAISDLRSRGCAEHVDLLGREIFIDYGNGIAGSSLIPSQVERLIAQSVTARNWNTIIRLNNEVVCPA